MSFLSESIGIDPGTSYVKIIKKGAGIVLNEPTVAVMDNDSGKIIAVGLEAEEMIIKAPASIRVVKPIKNGEVCDFDAAKVMFQEFLGKCLKDKMIKPKSMVAIGDGTSDVAKRAIEEALTASGVKNVSFVQKSISAAIGVGLPVYDFGGNMIIDIGGGTTEIAVISFGSIVASKTVDVGGDAFNHSIIRYIKNKYGVSIGQKMAEEVKNATGKIQENSADDYMVVGRDVFTGLPGSANISSIEIREAVNENISVIIDGIREALEHTPLELVEDIMEKGAVLTGGGAGVFGICELIDNELDIHASLAENPHTCVINGLGMIMQRS